MLPIVDKPAIQYVVEEAVAAGLSDVLFITGRSKRSLEDHFDRNVELEAALAAKGDQARLELVSQATDLARIHYVRQLEALGLGHAVLCAEQHVGNESFAVLLGDDLIDQRDAVLPRMIEVQQRYGGSVVCLMEVEPHEISQYGAAAVEATDEVDVVRVTDLVEKPAVEEAPSGLAVIGRYVLSPDVFPVLRSTAPGRGGEIQLTDALRTLARDGSGVHGVLFRGRRYDTGNKLSYLQATVRIALDREDLGVEFRQWLQDLLAGAEK